MTTNLVSCVCPTFSRPKFLEQAVRFFLRQTWQRSELLVFDDSPRELQADIPDSPRVKVFRFKDRLTMGEKHNLGLAHAQGDLIAHFDDDDWMSPLRLVRQVEALVLRDLDVCGFMTDYLLTTGDARFWRFDRTFGKTKKLVGNATVASHIPFMDGTAMFRRAVVGEAKYPTIPVGQKVVFLDGVWKAGARLKELPNDGIYIYVRHRRGNARNTWQYNNDRRLLPLKMPWWFPEGELDFYRRVI